MARILKKFDDFGVLPAMNYGGGFALGLPEGPWLSIERLAEAVWTLVRLPYDVDRYLPEKVPELRG